MSAPTATGWVDDRLMRAYDLIESVLLEKQPGTDAHAALKQARDNVEAADTELEKAA